MALSAINMECLITLIYSLDSIQIKSFNLILPNIYDLAMQLARWLKEDFDIIKTIF